jgi:hypothetical protein
MQDPFWFDDLEILFKKDRLTEFFPTGDQSLEEKLNSIVRFSLYISIILFFYNNDPRYLAIFVGAGLFTYYIYKNRIVEKFDDVSVANDHINEKCTKPTLDNPFMNVTMKDYLNIDPQTQRIVDRPPACNTSDPETKKEMDNYFNNNLFKDVNDVFGKMNSQRQFFTMPWTTIPNAQDEFAKWLYKSESTCKENQDRCLQYEDLRSNRQVFGNPFENPVQER